MVGASAFGPGRRLRALPMLLALAAAGLGGFLLAQWASRRAAPAVAPVQEPAVASVPPGTAPPATFAAPYLPAAPPARASEPVVRPRTDAPAPPVAASARPAAPAPQPQAPPAGATTYTLQAVTQQDGQPVAIVNGQLVRVGDVLEGGRILRIDADAVEIEKDGRRIVVPF